MNPKCGWDAFICEFFYTVCVDVLGPYFKPLGFVEEKSKINGVVFKQNDLYVEVSYVPETAPNYSPSLIVGIGSYKYDSTGKSTGLPAWSILSDNDKARNYSFWNFGDEKELATTLNKLKTEIIEPHIQPLWEDRIKLEREIKKFG